MKTNVENDRFLPAVQFSLVVFKNWHQRYPDIFVNILSALVSNTLKELEASEVQLDSDVKQLGGQLIFLIRTWWIEMEQQQYIQTGKKQQKKIC